jgi:hypothetical protein
METLVVPSIGSSTSIDNVQRCSDVIKNQTRNLTHEHCRMQSHRTCRMCRMQDDIALEIRANVVQRRPATFLVIENVLNT